MEISTQIGVDILGFPIYRIFVVDEVVKPKSKFKTCNNKEYEKELVNRISTIKQR